MDNYLALVLSAFIRNGLLEVSSDFKLNCKNKIRSLVQYVQCKATLDVICAPYI